MVLVLCILAVAVVTLSLIALVDRPEVRTPPAAAPAQPRPEALDPYVMR